MEVFNTPAFRTALSSRGGSPFAVLTASQQLALYNSFDASVTAFRDHPGSSLNPGRTNDDVEALYQAIGYMITSVVCPSFFISPLFLNLLSRYSPISPTIYFAANLSGSTLSAVYFLNSTPAMPMQFPVDSLTISLLASSSAFIPLRSGFFLSSPTSAILCIFRQVPFQISRLLFSDFPPCRPLKPTGSALTVSLAVWPIGPRSVAGFASDNISLLVLPLLRSTSCQLYPFRLFSNSNFLRSENVLWFSEDRRSHWSTALDAILGSGP